MSRARKALIVREASPVSETAFAASEIADAIHRLADECAGIAGALSYLAASKHSTTAGDQRLLGGAIYHTSVQRFGGVKYDGEPIDQKTIDDLAKMMRSLLRK